MEGGEREQRGVSFIPSPPVARGERARFAHCVGSQRVALPWPAHCGSRAHAVALSGPWQPAPPATSQKKYWSVAASSASGSSHALASQLRASGSQSGFASHAACDGAYSQRCAVVLQYAA